MNMHWTSLFFHSATVYQFTGYYQLLVSFLNKEKMAENSTIWLAGAKKPAIFINYRL